MKHRFQTLDSMAREKICLAQLLGSLFLLKPFLSKDIQGLICDNSSLTECELGRFLSSSLNAIPVFFSGIIISLWPLASLSFPLLPLYCPSFLIESDTFLFSSWQSLLWIPTSAHSHSDFFYSNCGFEFGKWCHRPVYFSCSAYTKYNLSDST